METDSALLWGLLFLILIVIATVTFLLIHSGLLTTVEVKTCKPDIGEIKIAYKFARGPYKESGTLYTQVHTLLPEYRTLGVYYDDPKTKQPHKLRYIVGIIVSENGSATPQEHIELLEKHGYHFATFPAIDHAVQTRFPFNSTISIIVAIMKVYPAIREYIEAKSLCARPFLEVYDSKKAEIIFVGPLARQDDFYVPEVLLEEEDQREDDFEDDRTENSSRSWDESASIIRGHDINDSECSESVGDDSSSFTRPLPPPPLNVLTDSPAGMPVLPPPGVSAPPTHDVNDSECSESLDEDTIPPPQLSPQSPPLPPQSDAPSEPLLPSQPTSVLSPSDLNPCAPAQVSTFPAAPVVPADVGETLERTSTGDVESDANTASSFEEIDEKEAASIPDVGIIGSERRSTSRKDEDEVER
ncbi:hypothetical protein SK128_019491 [Halocaridina rubra]|uniref:GyrI-like small molecule binding domain-containing protein n=1 Tax=Halocaridina rubra TaxID=373956 RepID=A0AAN8XDT6_HALRR